MMRWYADNSELRGIWGAAIQDILFYGGICVNEDSRERLCGIMRAVKSGYDGDVNFPLKWNFLGLRDHYRDLGKEQLYERLLQASKRWRMRIFREIASVDFTIIMSVIHGYGRDQNVQRRTMQRLTRHVFSNALMRLGMHIRENGCPYTELVLDWPPGGDKSLFDSEYRCAYFSGRDSLQQLEFFCGPLKNIGFSDSLLYASTNECALLQLCDLIVGAVKDLVDFSLGRTRGTYGRNRVHEIKHRFRGAPDRVIGKGISIAPTHGDLYDRLRRTVEDLYVEPS